MNSTDETTPVLLPAALRALNRPDLSLADLRSLIDAGKLTCTMFGGQRHVTLADVKAALAAPDKADAKASEDTPEKTAVTASTETEKAAPAAKTPAKIRLSQRNR